MERRQAVYRTLPPRQASHALFVGAIVDKYGGMQRHAGRLPLTHRLAASPDRKRKTASKPTPLQVQIVLPYPAPSPVRVIERDRPVYRDRPASAVTPAKPESAKPDRGSAAKPPKERIIEREKVIERERILERVVEKKVVIVREVERIIREQRILREQAVTLPIRGSDAAPSPSDVQRKQRSLPDSPLVHMQNPAQTDRSQERGDSRTRESANPVPGAYRPSQTKLAYPSHSQPVRHAGQAELPEQADPSRSMEGSGRVEPSWQADQPRPSSHADHSVQTNQSNIAERTGRAAPSGQDHTPDRLDETLTDANARNQSERSFLRVMQRQSWPLHVAKTSGWRPTPERVRQEKGKSRSQAKRDRRNRNKPLIEPRKQTARSARAESSVPGIVLVNRKTRRSDGQADRPRWRLTSANPPPWIDIRSLDSQALPESARTQADTGVSATIRTHGSAETGIGNRPTAAGRAIVAAPLYFGNSKPVPYRFVQAWKQSDSAGESPRGMMSSARSFVPLAHRLRNSNGLQEGAAAKPAFLQGEALLRRTIPLTWSTQAAKTLASPADRITSAQPAQKNRELLEQSGKGGRQQTRGLIPEEKDASPADAEPRWSSLRPVHVRKRASHDANQPQPEFRRSEEDAGADHSEAPDPHARAAASGSVPSADSRNASPSVSVQDPHSAVQNATPGGFAQEAESKAIEPVEEAEEVVRAKLMRSGLPERAAIVHARQGTGEDGVQAVKGEIKRSEAEHGRNALGEMDPTERAGMPIAKFARSGTSRKSGGNEEPNPRDRRTGAFLQERGLRIGSRPLKSLTNLYRAAETPGRHARGTIKRDVNAPGTFTLGANPPVTILQRSQARRSSVEAMRTPVADNRSHPLAESSTHGRSGTSAFVPSQRTNGRNAIPSIPFNGAVQDGIGRQRDVPSRAAALLWPVGQTGRQRGADRLKQGPRQRTESEAAMIQRRSAMSPSRQGQAASGGQPSLPRHGRASPPASSRQSAAAIAMQPLVPLFGSESVAAAMRQWASFSDESSMGMTPIAWIPAPMSAGVASRMSHRVQFDRQLGHDAALGSQKQTTPARTNTPAVLQPAEPAGAKTAFDAVPLAYASAQTGSAAASVSHVSPISATPGSAAAPQMELRRQPAPPPAAPAPEASASPNAVKAAIDPEQLQQAISKLPMLNPDQIADQVYKAIARRMKFEQRLQGY